MWCAASPGGLALATSLPILTLNAPARSRSLRGLISLSGGIGDVARFLAPTAHAPGWSVLVVVRIGRTRLERITLVRWGGRMLRYWPWDRNSDGDTLGHSESAHDIR